jgi:uncharacterized spore protein YtfJ
MSTTNPTETTAVKRSNSFLTQLIDRITLGTNARMIYGDPIERDGVTVIPVGKVRWGLGGGEGGDVEGNGGSGGGGGITVSPIGFIEIKDGLARFRPIFDPALIVQIISASAFASLLLLVGARKIVEVAKKKR